MGDMQPGVTVFDEKGSPCLVTAVSSIDEAQDAYRLTFDDGVTLDADAEHLWLTFTARDLGAMTRRTDKFRARRRSRRPSRSTGVRGQAFAVMMARRNSANPTPSLPPPTGAVRTTREIVETLRTSQGRANHAIPVALPLELPDIDLPMDPYLLGCWLGDGTTVRGDITSADPEILDAFRAIGPVITQRDHYTWKVDGLSAVLRDVGVLGRKHIPAAYLRASRAQRLALLCGLMDSDGTVTDGTSVSFSTTRPELRDGCAELIRSLGWKVNPRESRAILCRAGQAPKDCGPTWDLNWTASEHVFRLPRKRVKQILATRRTTRFRYIVAAERIPPTPMRCIAVDSPSRLYLAGSSFIPTHNTYALVLEPLRHHKNAKFDAVIFRRTTKQVTQAGGLWATSEDLYPAFSAKQNEQDLLWSFPSGATVKFAHMEHAKNRFDWDGSQVALIGFDQLEGFLEIQFWYMLSRLRSMSGVRPYVRATCNPVPEDDETGGWLRTLIAWWIDNETGLAIPERSGVIRWLARINDTVEWADSAAELIARFPHLPPDAVQPLSFTFILAKLDDNKILLSVDPGYRAKLLALPKVERERLLGGNWNIRASAGNVFNEAWFKSTPARPLGSRRRVRYWDKAGTQGGGKYTAGVLISVASSPTDTIPVCVEDVKRGQWSAMSREEIIKQTAHEDNALGLGEVDVWIEQEPGSGGKESAEATVKNLGGFTVHVDRVTGDKLSRASALSAQAEAGNVYLAYLPGSAWQRPFLRELHACAPEATYLDQVDAASGAYNKAILAAPKTVFAAVEPKSKSWQEAYFRR